jgi:hypothetical protein
MVVVAHNLPQLGAWDRREEPLYDEDGPLWYEHPTAPSAIDVVALPLTNEAGTQAYAHDPWDTTDLIATGISEPLHIIGFPFGATGGGFLGVWVRGFIASEPGLDWNGLPCFLIDSRTRAGQSGAPVIAYTTGPRQGATNFVWNGVPAEQFVGVYSGRINAESDLGFVWKARAVREVVDTARRATEYLHAR